MTFPIVHLGHPALRRTAREVTPDEIVTDGEPGPIVRIAAWMATVMRAHGGVGIAAPQIAMNVRLFLAAPTDEKLTVFVNPTVVDDGDEEKLDDEGCLSIPGLNAKVYRPTKLTVTALDLAGEPFTYEATGFRARILAHEIDHLNGTLICDHLGGPDGAAYRHWFRCRALGLPHNQEALELAAHLTAARRAAAPAA